MNNDEKIKKALEREEVPEELSPERIKTMLDEKAPSEKRKKVNVAGRIGAMAASLAVIAGATLVYANTTKPTKNCPTTTTVVETGKKSTDTETKQETTNENKDNLTVKKTGSYMSGAENYEQIYTMFKDYSESFKSTEISKRNFDSVAGTQGVYAENSIEMEEVAEEEYYFDNSMVDGESPTIIADTGGLYSETGMGAGDTPDYSETYNQEENVLEADIVKTDGKNIYYLTNSYDENYYSVPVIDVATVENGTFTDYGRIFIKDSLSDYFSDDTETNIYVQDMYLYNDMIVVIGSVGADYYICYDSEDYSCYKNSCFVSFYTTDGTPQLIGTYCQDGNYNDVRISPDGYMYLITDYSTGFYNVKSSEQIEKYIPSCAVNGEFEYLPADCILLPEQKEVTSFSYSVIGSIDLTQSGAFNAVETKALAGYAGDIYCSGSNIYTTSGYRETEITRIAICQGNISPEAAGKVDGRVNDSFSMSEYNGYFRIAVTNDEYEEVYRSYYGDDDKEPNLWERIEENITGTPKGYYGEQLVKRDNRVYVLDMNLDMVGSVSDFGIDESIKSVKFSGDMAYVVTYEQTDPLFAIDLSNPTNPVILDEFKILGYSTYMQEWTDGLLLGFGVNADENGIETGIKLTMFDNSDPYNLKAVGTYTLDRENSDSWIYSEGVWERKALLIAPEKNLIGIPVVIENYHYNEDYNYYGNDSETSYMFFSYDNGEFNFKGSLGRFNDFDSSYFWFNFNRAVYIGNYVYVMNGNEFISADMETITEIQRISFADAKAFEVSQPTTESETEQPTESETEQPTESETEQPTESETEQPTESETEQPTESETEQPTESETEQPTESETEQPTEN